METQLTALQANAALMVQLGFSQGFADAYAKAYTNANFTTTYRLHTMDVSWAAKDGVQIDMMVSNYIEIRADKFLPQGEEPSNVSGQVPAQPTAPPVQPGGL